MSEYVEYLEQMTARVPNPVIQGIESIEQEHGEGLAYYVLALIELAMNHPIEAKNLVVEEQIK